jgi:hypothetical protein
VAYLALAAGFSAAGAGAYREIRRVPVELKIRSHRSKGVVALTAVWSLCFTLRSAALLWLSAQPPGPQRPPSGPLVVGQPYYLAVGVYFTCLEVPPLLVALYFFRTFPRASRVGNCCWASAEQGLLDVEEEEEEEYSGAGSSLLQGYAPG